MTQTAESTRKLVQTLLEEDHAPGERIRSGLERLRTSDRIPAFSYALEFLIHKHVDEPEAERLWSGLFDHRRELAERLGRDPGLRVAATDYFSNVVPMLTSPVVLDLGHWEQLERSAITDDLTGLFNRRHILEIFDGELARCRRYAQPLALLGLDLDSFKPVNDLYGHPFGDKVLQFTAEVLRSAIRDSDACGRIGGEEFAVVLPETDRVGAYVVAERIRSELRRRFRSERIENRMVAMTISGGVAFYPDDGADSKALMEAADSALYRAKSAGRDRIVLYRDERRKSVRFPFHHTCRVTLERVQPGSAEAPTPAEPHDLSTGGALLGLPAGVAAHEPVCLRLENLETAENGEEDTTVTGRVLRVEDLPDQGFRVAVAFDRPLAPEVVARHVLYPAAARTRSGR